jgi:quinol monooxygenase YgiN
VKRASASGLRAALVEVLGGDDSNTVAGCLRFIVAEDAADQSVVWVTEVWASEASHQASLALPPSESG